MHPYSPSGIRFAAFFGYLHLAGPCKLQLRIPTRRQPPGSAAAARSVAAVFAAVSGNFSFG